MMRTLIFLAAIALIAAWSHSLGIPSPSQDRPPYQNISQADFGLLAPGVRLGMAANVLR